MRLSTRLEKSIPNEYLMGVIDRGILAIEQEAGRLAVAEALSVERIAAALRNAEGNYLIFDSPTAVADLAAKLRAALSPEQPEVTE